MSNYGNSDAGGLDDLHSVTQKLEEPWPDSKFPSHKYNKSYYRKVTKSRPNPSWVKDCLQTGGLKRVGPRSSSPTDPFSSP